MNDALRDVWRLKKHNLLRSLLTRKFRLTLLFFTKNLQLVVSRRKSLLKCICTSAAFLLCLRDACCQVGFVIALARSDKSKVLGMTAQKNFLISCCHFNLVCSDLRISFNAALARQAVYRFICDLRKVALDNIFALIKISIACSRNAVVDNCWLDDDSAPIPDSQDDVTEASCMDAACSR